MSEQNTHTQEQKKNQEKQSFSYSVRFSILFLLSLMVFFFAFHLISILLHEINTKKLWHSATDRIIEIAFRK